MPLDTELTFIGIIFISIKSGMMGKFNLKYNADDHENSEILPVSLQILVENAIKHNKATRENPLKISIGIENNIWL